MLRAPTWKTSATSATASMSRTSISSVTIGRPVCALASSSSRSPSWPRPWNEYGDVRGLYAPPRYIAAPADATACAAVSTWSRDSTVHGPAISVKWSPPTLRPAMSSTLGRPPVTWAEASL